MATTEDDYRLLKDKVLIKSGERCGETIVNIPDVKSLNASEKMWADCFRHRMDGRRFLTHVQMQEAMDEAVEYCKDHKD